jgi:hypothetical protein
MCPPHLAHPCHPLSNISLPDSREKKSFKPDSRLLSVAERDHHLRGTLGGGGGGRGGGSGGGCPWHVYIYTNKRGAAIIALLKGKQETRSSAFAFAFVWLLLARVIPQLRWRSATRSPT